MRTTVRCRPLGKWGRSRGRRAPARPPRGLTSCHRLPGRPPHAPGSDARGPFSTPLGRAAGFARAWRGDRVSSWVPQLPALERSHQPPC